MKRAVFLDRDGVINRSKLVDGIVKPPGTIAEVEILRGVIEAIKTIKAHDFTPVVVTNQPDVARGVTSKAHVDAINAYIGAITDIEFFYTCFHDDVDMCGCRKPAPGLINRAAIDLNLDISNSYLVGDRWRDIAAGQEAGCRAFFIDYSYPEKSPEMPFTRVSSLLEAAQILIGEPDVTK